jgi:hypothetical protein
MLVIVTAKHDSFAGEARVVAREKLLRNELTSWERIRGTSEGSDVAS